MISNLLIWMRSSDCNLTDLFIVTVTFIWWNWAVLRCPGSLKASAWSVLFYSGLRQYLKLLPGSVFSFSFQSFSPEIKSFKVNHLFQSLVLIISIQDSVHLSCLRMYGLHVSCLLELFGLSLCNITWHDIYLFFLKLVSQNNLEVSIELYLVIRGLCVWVCIFFF